MGISTILVALHAFTAFATLLVAATATTARSALAFTRSFGHVNLHAFCGCTWRFCVGVKPVTLRIALATATTAAAACVAAFGAWAIATFLRTAFASRAATFAIAPIAVAITRTVTRGSGAPSDVR